MMPNLLRFEASIACRVFISLSPFDTARITTTDYPTADFPSSNMICELPSNAPHVTHRKASESWVSAMQANWFCHPPPSGGLVLDI
jgi:hypothetical protein